MGWQMVSTLGFGCAGETRPRGPAYGKVKNAMTHRLTQLIISLDDAAAHGAVHYPARGQI